MSSSVRLWSSAAVLASSGRRARCCVTPQAHDDPSAQRDFRAHANAITHRHGQWMGLFIVLAALAWWPADYLLFADAPHVIEAFRFWRVTCGGTALLGLCVLTLLRDRVVPMFPFSIPFLGLVAVFAG